MRPHLVRVNSSIVSQAPLAFYAVLATEILLCLFILFCAPMLCVSIWRVGSIHRNFRTQSCLAAAFYCTGILARFVLIYYQLNDISLTDDDIILLVAEIVRNANTCYYCNLAAAFEIQILVALYRWKWYEKSSTSTSLVIISTEIVNLMIAFTNAGLWLNGNMRFIYCIAFDGLALSLSISGFMIIYTKNIRQLEKLSKENISVGSYTVGRSFQYILRVMIPAAAVGSVCFIFAAFNMYGPSDWNIARSLSYALYDLFFALFRAVYLIGELREHPLVRREFLQLPWIRWLRGGKTPSSSTPPLVARNTTGATDAYFAQFRQAWD